VPSASIAGGLLWMRGIPAKTLFTLGMQYLHKENPDRNAPVGARDFSSVRKDSLTEDQDASAASQSLMAL
jgi:hypothetical protein